jgi:acetyl-CoA carboxylase biotin carboxylase subunit
VIRRVLIANRGEIAIRIARACHEMGIEAVSVYSEADLTAPHVGAGDSAVPIGPAPAIDSYLNVPAIVDAARSSGCDAVHPGYGFLSQSARFVRACEEAGLVFVGPTADVMARMGSKIEARRLMESSGVRVVPGATPSDQSDETLTSTARAVGLPVMVKASAGGGGKGMRIVRSAGELPEAIASARREAVAAFGDGTIYFEKVLERPRHIEVQILGDGEGDAIHLFERECSMQRRHQKVIEESPAPAVAPAVREEICDAAVRAARAVRYRGAGTIEFLIERDARSFYFLEMNTRLQVEHAVTELVLDVDLVRAQLAIAGGQGLPWQQQELSPRGHAVECRIYAEDPFDRFLPQAGRVLMYRPPLGPGIRFDSGIAEGTDVSVHYDPLLAKLVAHAGTRDAAIARAVQALRSTVILGIMTNVPFLLQVLRDDRFASGAVDTTYLDQWELRPSLTPELPAAAVAAGAWLHGGTTIVPEVASTAGVSDPWTTIEGWL